MKLVDGRTGIESLDPEECLRLLGSDEIGRLAINIAGTPAIMPVNYRLDGTAIVFRTDPSTKLTAGPRSPVAFEVDAFDREHRTGWSVVVTGRLDEVTQYDGTTFERVRQLPVDPWAGGDKDHWMRLVPDHMIGRRLAPEPGAGQLSSAAP